ncbi:MAG TPA: phage scaffolding protein [Armatimonadota bacterium]|nr:phage scaffolding protein [Armatimonadota bacterium]
MEHDETRVGELEAALHGAVAERDGLAARVTELEEQVRTGDARWRASARDGALALALQQASCRDVEAALRLLDAEGVTVDDAGVVQGAAEAVAALKTARGYLFTPRALGAAANPGGGAPGDPAAAFAEWLRRG